MNASAFEPIDHGPRSNESTFGDLEPIMATSDSNIIFRHFDGPITADLPFEIGIVDDDAMLERVQALRAQAYGHHVPSSAHRFSLPDPVDRLPNTTIFFAMDKATGNLVGSARLQTNRSGPLQIESSLELPAKLKGQSLAEVSRLTVLPGYVGPVRLALVKMLHMFCIANQITGIVAASRRNLLRTYLSIGFTDLYGDERLVPMSHGAGLPHRVLFRDTVTAEADSRMHPDYAFAFRTYHPDIKVFSPLLQQSHQGLGTPSQRPGYSTRAA